MLMKFLGRLRKPLAVIGLAVGLTAGVSEAASANAWTFSYTAGGTNVAGLLFGTLNAGGWWDINSVSGARDGNAITGLWCGDACVPSDNNYLIDAAAGAPGSPAWVDPQMDLHYLVGTDEYIFAFTGGKTPFATDGTSDSTLIDYPNSGRCVTSSEGCTEVTTLAVSAVPEINASAGLGALGVLFGFVLIMREMFMRRRNFNGSPA